MTLPDWLDPVYTADEMRACDAWAIDEQGIPSLDLMERAALGLARLAAEIAGRADPIRIVCGKGNNGGDGIAVARLLRDEGREADLLLTVDPGELRGDAAANLERLPGRPPEPFDADRLAGSAVIIDALLGTGFEGSPREPLAGAIQAINGSGAPVVACDVPSGVNAATGEVGGEAVRAVATATFHGPKIGLCVAPGKLHAGEVRTIEIGIPRGGPEPSAAGLISERVLDLVPSRLRDGSKFTSGRVAIVGGARGLTGAPGARCARGPARGSGLRPTRGPSDGAAHRRSPPARGDGAGDRRRRRRPHAGAAPTRRSSSPSPRERSCSGRASGAPTEPSSSPAGWPPRRISRCFWMPTGSTPTPAAWAISPRASAPTVLTPHAGELARLLDTDSADIEAHRLRLRARGGRAERCDRRAQGRRHDRREPGRAGRDQPRRDPALATAGTGDVLSGVIGTLLAKGMEPLAAAAGGVLAHARAGELAAERHDADHVVAGDVIDALPDAFAAQ